MKDKREKDSYSLIGFASGFGGRVPGAKDGPAELRRLGLVEKLSPLAKSIIDLGDISPNISAAEEADIKTLLSDEELKTKHPVEVYDACKKLYDLTTQALEKNTTPLILGGAHSCSIGSISAISNHFSERGEKIGVIWVDAHGDINTPVTSLSGNLHGMSLSFLLGLSKGGFQSLCKQERAVSPSNLGYIGLRDLDEAEKEILNSSTATVSTMKDIDIDGIASATRKAIAAASNGTAGFVVSFDLDVCDPELVPGTGTPYRGGLTFREAHLVLELIHESGKMLGFELVEYNPSLDKDSKTAELAFSLCESALGSTIL